MRIDSFEILRKMKFIVYLEINDEQFDNLNIQKDMSKMLNLHNNLLLFQSKYMSKKK